MSGIWPLRALRWTYVAFIVGASLQTALAGWHGAHAGPHGAAAMLALAIPEILAALILLIEMRATEIAACAVLLAVYAAAAAISHDAGYLVPLRFAYYAATAVLIAAARRRPAPATA
jgi:hypothetical protein